MKRHFALAAAAVISAATFLPAAPAQADGPAASQWAIGPIIRGRNYSVNMPRTLSDSRAGPTFEFPGPDKQSGHVHYVTVPTRSLEGAKRITLRYRIDATRSTRFIAQEAPGEAATLSLYFQRQGDRWSMRTPHHRWYSPNSRLVRLQPGEHELSIALDETWIAMTGGDNRTLPREFAAALAQTGEVGFVFGSGAGRGHGVYATGPARFTVLDFTIE